MKNKNILAFTLIELLVVIVIIGVLSGIGISQFKSYTDKARLAKAKSFAIQIKKVFFAENTLSENIGKTFLFNFSNEIDPNSNPIIDDTQTKQSITLNSFYGGSASIENDKELGLGNVLSLDHSQFISTISTPFESDSFTASFWVKPETFPLANQPYHTFPFYIQKQNRDNAILFELTPNKTVKLFLSSGYFPLNPIVEIESEKISENKWHHIAASYNGNKIKFWVNGDLVGEQSNVDFNTSNLFARLALGFSFYAPVIKMSMKDVFFIPNNLEF